MIEAGEEEGRLYFILFYFLKFEILHPFFGVQDPSFSSLSALHLLFFLFVFTLCFLLGL